MTPEEQASADAAAAEAARVAQEQQQQENDPATPPATVDGQTPQQIRDALARLASLEAAETQRVADAETARQQTLSDIQREQERATAAETATQAAQTALEAEQRDANALRLRVALGNSARDLGHALHPSALDDAMRLGDFENIAFNDAREPQGVTEALKDLIARKPYLVARTEAPNLSGDASGRDDGVDEPAKARASAALLRGF